MTAAREENLIEILKKIAVEQNYEDPVFETSAVPTTGANFTSQLFHGIIKSAGKKDLHVFAKVSVLGDTLRKEAGSFEFYLMENYFYTQIVKRYRELEDENDVPEENRLNIPKCYGYSNDYLKEVLVMEDLTKDGFVTYDRLKSVDWEYASKSIEEIAKFHALSIAYIEKYPEHYEEAKKVLKRPILDENSALTKMFKCGMKQATAMVRDENKAKLEKFFESFDPEKFSGFYEPRKKSAIIHGDFRPSNLMHKHYEDGSLKIVVVDFQTMHPGNVAADLLYYIFTGSDGKFRAQYYDQLIDHYYEYLAASLKRLGLDPEVAFPRDLFDEELKEILPFGLTIATIMLPLITINVEDVTTNAEGVHVSESFADMGEMMLKSNSSICAERINEVVDDYVKWGVL